jgi:hypothetical protein
VRLPDERRAPSRPRPKEKAHHRHEKQIPAGGGFAVARTMVSWCSALHQFDQEMSRWHRFEWRGGNARLGGQLKGKTSAEPSGKSSALKAHL